MVIVNVIDINKWQGIGKQSEIRMATALALDVYLSLSIIQTLAISLVPIIALVLGIISDFSSSLLNRLILAILTTAHALT